MVSTQVVRMGPQAKKEKNSTQAVLAGDFMYLSGQLPMDRKTGKITSHNITDQLQLIFSNFRRILNAQSLSLSNVVKITAFLRNETDYPALEKVLTSVFASRYPAMTIVYVDRLADKDAKICLDAVA